MSESQDTSYVDALKRAMDAFNAGDLVGGIESVEGAMGLDPSRAEAYFLLGCANVELGRAGSAITLFRKAVQIDPDVREYADILGATLLRNGLLTEGLYYSKLSTALEPHPLFPGFAPPKMVHAPSALLQTMVSLYIVEAMRAENACDYEAAITHAREEIQINPDQQDAYRLLARCLTATGRHGQAVATVCGLVHGGNARIDDYRSLVTALARQGRREAASACIGVIRRTWPHDIAANAAVIDTLPLLGPVDVAVHDQARRAIAAAVPGGGRGSPTPGKGRIRVGVLSDRFLDDPASRPVETLFQHLDQGRFSLFAYQQNFAKQSATHRLSARADNWREVADLDDETVADIVAGDEIDVLVDLCVTGRGQRIAAVGACGTPVRIAWLGTGEVAGLPVHDVVIGDATTEAADRALLGEGQRWVAVPHLLAFLPFAPTEPSPSPISEAGAVTFGAVADMAMLAPDRVADWAEILLRLPGARLMLGDAGNLNAATLSDMVDLFGLFGVADRIFFQDGIDERAERREAHQAPLRDEFLASIDILLDGAPLSLGDRVAEALWAGVPVVTRRSPLGRAGLSAATALAAARRSDWIFEPDAFVDGVVALASDGDALVTLRSALRDEVKASPLFDGASFARAMEAAFLMALGE